MTRKEITMNDNNMLFIKLRGICGKLVAVNVCAVQEFRESVMLEQNVTIIYYKNGKSTIVNHTLAEIETLISQYSKQ
jgi:hypothetical protein